MNPINISPTEYNDAFGFIQRMNICWMDTIASRRAKDINGWIDALLSICSGLSSEMDTERVNVIIDNLTRMQAKMNTDNRLCNREIYSLWSVEIELQGVWDERHYKTKRSRDASKAIG